MKKFTFDFMLNIWLQDIEIEADSYDEALDILYSMDVEDLIKEGYVKDYNISQVDCEKEDNEIVSIEED